MDSPENEYFSRIANELIAQDLFLITNDAVETSVLFNTDNVESPVLTVQASLFSLFAGGSKWRWMRIALSLLVFSLSLLDAESILRVRLLFGVLFSIPQSCQKASRGSGKSGRFGQLSCRWQGKPAATANSPLLKKV